MFTTLAGAAITAVTTLGLATAAAPSSIGIEDPADVEHGVDLRAVQIDNTDTFVRVALTHADITPSADSFAGGAVYLDTDPGDPGPELVFIGGYFEGTDYNLLTTDGFGVDQWGQPVDARWRMRLDFDHERTVMRMSRKAVGADEIRVAVKVSGEQSDGTQVTDWLGERRSFTEWLDRG